jgi:hypothetical protein
LTKSSTGVRVGMAAEEFCAFLQSSAKIAYRYAREMEGDFCVARIYRHGSVVSPCAVAERVGFEPTVELPRLRFSRPSDSATLAPLRTRPDKEVQLNVVNGKIQMKSCGWMGISSSLTIISQVNKR